MGAAEERWSRGGSKLKPVVWTIEIEAEIDDVLKTRRQGVREGGLTLSGAKNNDAIPSDEGLCMNRELGIENVGRTRVGSHYGRCFHRLVQCGCQSPRGQRHALIQPLSLGWT